MLYLSVVMLLNIKAIEKSVCFFDKKTAYFLELFRAFMP